MSVLGRARHRLAVIAKEQAALSDWPSRRRMLGLRAGQLRRGDVAEPSADTAVPVNVKATGGGPLYLRPRSSDVELIWDTYVAGWYLPPAEVREAPMRRIVEMGTNIGAALAGLASRYPDAQLLGVEPDPENVRLARRNLLRFGKRCSVVESAIWDREAELVVDRTRREYGLVVRPRTPEDPAEWPTVAARPPGAILAGFAPGEPIDYLFMDIEGCEQRVLEADDVTWAQRVRSIRVECENEYDGDPEGCARALARLGFTPRIEPYNWGAFVFGVREPARA